MHNMLFIMILIVALHSQILGQVWSQWIGEDEAKLLAIKGLPDKHGYYDGDEFMKFIVAEDDDGVIAESYFFTPGGNGYNSIIKYVKLQALLTSVSKCESLRKEYENICSEKLGIKYFGIADGNRVFKGDGIGLVVSSNIRYYKDTPLYLLDMTFVTDKSSME